MAMASFDSSNSRKTQSTIFKWNEYRFQLYQSLYTFGAQSWTYFEIDNQVRRQTDRKVSLREFHLETFSSQYDMREPVQ